MAKRNTPRKSKRKPSTSGGTPQGGDRLKLRRTKVGQNLSQNEEPPLDLEPDGAAGTNPARNTLGNQYDALSDEDNDDSVSLMEDEGDEEVVEVAPPTPLPADLEPDGHYNKRLDFTTRFRTAHDLNPPPLSDQSDDDLNPTQEPFQLVVNRGKANKQKPRRSKRRRTKRKHESVLTPILHTASPSRAARLRAKEDDEDEDDDDYESDFQTDCIPCVMDKITQAEVQTLCAETHEDLSDIKRALHYPINDIDDATANSDAYSHKSFIDLVNSVDGDADMHDSTSSESSMSTRNELGTKKSYAEIAQQGKSTDFQPKPLDPTRSIRYSVRISVPPQDNQLKAMCSLLKQILTLAQRVLRGTVGFAVWNPDFIGPPAPPIYKLSALPSGEEASQAVDKSILQRYFDHWNNGDTPGKDKVSFLKLHFVTEHPSKLAFPLTDIGEQLSNHLSVCPDAKVHNKVSLSRQKLACQCAKSVTVGWLFGSVKSMHEDTLLAGLRKQVNIPPHVALGLRWKVIRNSKKGTPVYDKSLPPSPQALTLEIDETWYGRFAGDIAKLWKKYNRKLVCGLQLRLVPCFTSPRMAVADDATKMDASLMALKQQHFVNKFALRLPSNSFIAFLDLPIVVRSPIDGTESNWTLRRHLMKASPLGFPSQRLFLTVDQNYNGNGYQLMTVRPFYDAAERTLSHMIPECLYLYGAGAAKWFTPHGVDAYKDTTWNPKEKATISSNQDMNECVDENFMGMGDEWKPEQPSERPIGGVGMLVTPATPAVLNPTVYATTAKEVAEQRDKEMRTDVSIKSFGDKIYDRPHDGDTVHTVAPDAAPPQLDINTPTVRIDLTGLEIDDHIRDHADDETISMSTMAHTTEDTRRRLKESDKQKILLTAENEQQALVLAARDQENEALQLANQAMMEQLSILQRRLDAAASTTPASGRRVHITEPDKGSNLARIGKPRLLRRNSPPPMGSPSAASSDGEPANTAAAGIGHHG
jgi:hypothetical protein